MAVRTETIVLEMEDQASREALAAIGPLQALDSTLDDLGKHAGLVDRRFASMTQRTDRMATSMDKANVSLGRTSAHLDSLGSRGLVQFTRNVDRGTASIDRFSGRVALLGTSVLAIGPTILPITAAAVPAIGALSAGMVGASAAAATLVLAFQGVGSSVEAISEYRLAPTADNLAKVREELERLGPDGTRFVMALDELRPALEDLQRLSRAGIFPGFTEGLDQLVTRLPQVRDFVEDISTRVGNLGAATGTSLAGDADWREFFAFVDDEAGPAMEEWGRATGNFVAGAANMVEALSELSGGVTGDVLQSSRDFREWADNLEHTEGFQEFASYVRESGPEVADAISSTANALVALATAAAPWGTAVLPILTTAADAFAAIAGSPIGPPLFTAAAALLAVSKASALLAPGLAKINTGIATGRTNIAGFGRDVGAMSREFSNLNRVQSTAMSFLSGTSSAAQRTRESLREAGRAAAAAGPGIAAFGALSTGAADQMNLTNTATLTLAGSMAGPWGAAVGAGAGLLMDFSKANNDAQQAVDELGQALDSGADFDVLSKKLEDAEKKVADYKKSLEFEGFANGGTWSEFWDQFWGNSKEPFSNQAEKNTEALKRSRAEIERLSTQQIFDDSLAGRTDAVGDAIARLGEDAISTAASASELAAALDALIAPEQNLIAAQDQLTSSIRHLGDDLDKQNKTLEGNSDAAIKNRAAISDRVTAIQSMITAEAEAGRGPEVVARSLAKQRQALIDSATAAGLNKREVEALVAQMNLTPELITTIFDNLGIDQSEMEARNLADRFNKLPKKLQTEIRNNGIPKSEADIDRLTRKYHLTPKQVRTLASLMNKASGPIGRILSELLNLDGRSATTTVVNRTINEVITVSRGQSTRPDRRVEPGEYADGGTIPGQRFPYGDKILMWGAPGEEVISNRNGEADRFRADRAAGRIPAYADGGTIDGYASGGRVRRSDPVAAALWQSGHRTPDASLMVGMTVRQLERLGRSFDDMSDKRLGRFGRSLDRASALQEKQTAAARKRFDAVADRRSQITDSISGGLRSDLWADDGGSAFGKQYAAGSIGSVTAQLRADRDRAVQFKKDIGTLRKKGLNGAALQEIIATGDYDRARMFASASKSAVGGYESAFNARQGATASAARYGGAILTPDFDKLKGELTKQIRELGAIKHELSSLRKEQKSQHSAAQKSRIDNGAGPAARKGARSR